MHDQEETRRIVRLPTTGLECPGCGCTESSVLRTRRYAGFVLRERECGHCHRRWSTTERPVTAPPQ